MFLSKANEVKAIEAMGTETVTKLKTIFDNQPAWLDAMGGIDDLAEVQGINESGCAGYPYMGAVTYHKALDTMEEHGDEIFFYIEEHLGEMPAQPKSESWSSMAVFYCSTAVEIWCNQFADMLSIIDLDG